MGLPFPSRSKVGSKRIRQNPLEGSSGSAIGYAPEDVRVRNETQQVADPPDPATYNAVH